MSNNLVPVDFLSNSIPLQCKSAKAEGRSVAALVTM